MARLAISSNFAKCISAKPLLTVNSVTSISKSTIVSKIFREPKNKPAPFPYKEKYYRVWTSWFDRTRSRFDENSKIIVVDGPIASGKTEFAKKLAEDLDMYYIPDANMDTIYINSYGYDLRKIDHLLPDSMKSFDEKNFCQDPFNYNVAGYQLWMYKLRYSLYVDALAHVLSTGQGVVIERSPWADSVFFEAMVKNKYISKEALSVYNEIKTSTMPPLMRPHLVIYLDMPVEVVEENIKKRGRQYEQNSKALTRAYLQDIDDFYKTLYLPQITLHAEFLMYDWSEGGDVEVVVEDIERIDFDQYTKHDKRMADWGNKPRERDWAERRMLYADKKDYLMNLFNVPLLTAPELLVSGEDLVVYQDVISKASGMEYDEGYNPNQGDKNLFFKTKSSKYVPY